MKTVSAWLVARGGVSRLTLFATAIGLGVAGLRPQAAAPWLAATGLACAVVTALALGLGGVLKSGAAPSGWDGRAGGGVAPSGCDGRAAGGKGSGAARSALPIMLITLGLLMGVSLGSVRTAALLGGELARLAAMPGAGFDGQVVVTGRVMERSGGRAVAVRSLGPVGSGQELLLEITGIGGGGEAGTVEGGVVGGLTGGLDEGAILRVEGRLRLPESPSESGSGSASGSFDEAAWLNGQGIGVVLTVRAVDVRRVGERGGVPGLLDRLKSRARTHLALGLDPAMAGLLRGFILGDKSAIAAPTLEAFRRAGTAHLLAVSGLHVGSLAAAALVAAKAAGAPPWLRSVGAGVTAVVFMLLTGAGPSVVRATVMVLVMLAAGLAGRGRDSWSAVALAGVVVLAREPPVVGSPGFQLSFSAVISLLLLARWLETRLSRHLPATLATGVGVSLAASIGTAPVSLLTFGQVSVVGLAANPLVVPVVPAVMAFGTASIIAGFVWPGACVVLNTMAGVVIGWVTVVSRAFSKAPVVTGGDVVPFLAAIVGGSLGRLVWRRVRRRAPAHGGRRGPRPAAALAFVAVIAAGAAVGVGLVEGTTAGAARADLWWAGRAWPTGGEVRVLDVGEGAAVLVRSPERASVLIDAGPREQGLAGQLRGLGVGRLDAVVITHPHADHCDGLVDVLSVGVPRLLVDHVVPAEAPREDEAALYLDLQRTALAGGSHHLVPMTGESVEIGDVRLEFFTPPAPVAHREAGGWGRAEEGWATGAPADIGHGVSLTSEQVNQASLVVVVRVGGLAILVPGDAEAETLARYPLPDVDALVVSHHGSEGAVSLPLLNGLTPAVAVVPVGAGNTFGHPGAGTVRLLDEWGATLLRTDRSGWVALRPTGPSAVEVAVER